MGKKSNNNKKKYAKWSNKSIISNHPMPKSMFSTLIRRSHNCWFWSEKEINWQRKRSSYKILFRIKSKNLVKIMVLISIKKIFKTNIIKPKSLTKNILHKLFNYKEKSENIIYLPKISTNNRIKKLKMLTSKVLSCKFSKQSISFFRQKIKSNKFKINGSQILILWILNTFHCLQRKKKKDKKIKNFKKKSKFMNIEQNLSEIKMIFWMIEIVWLRFLSVLHWVFRDRLKRKH